MTMPTHDDTSKKSASGSVVSDETVLKLAKEIAVKFIEVGRITPANFPETFREIHAAIKETAAEDKA